MAAGAVAILLIGWKVCDDLKERKAVAALKKKELADRDNGVPPDSDSLAVRDSSGKVIGRHNAMPVPDGYDPKKIAAENWYNDKGQYVAGGGPGMGLNQGYGASELQGRLMPGVDMEQFKDIAHLI